MSVDSAAHLSLVSGDGPLGSLSDEQKVLLSKGLRHLALSDMIERLLSEDSLSVNHENIFCPTELRISSNCEKIQEIIPEHVKSYIPDGNKKGLVYIKTETIGAALGKIPKGLIPLGFPHLHALYSNYWRIPDYFTGMSLIFPASLYVNNEVVNDSTATQTNTFVPSLTVLQGSLPVIEFVSLSMQVSKYQQIAIYDDPSPPEKNEDKAS